MMLCLPQKGSPTKPGAGGANGGWILVSSWTSGGKLPGLREEQKKQTGGSSQVVEGLEPVKVESGELIFPPGSLVLKYHVEQSVHGSNWWYDGVTGVSGSKCRT